MKYVLAFLILLISTPSFGSQLTWLTPADDGWDAGDPINSDNLARIDIAINDNDDRIVVLEAVVPLLAADIGVSIQAYDADLDTWSGVTPGTGVAAAAAVSASAVGGLPIVIASGSQALDPASIASGACDSTTYDDIAATGVAATDVILWTPNADISAVTGYAPVTTGGVSIYPYPSTDAVNFTICNPTESPLDASAITVNWRVLR